MAQPSTSSRRAYPEAPDPRAYPPRQPATALAAEAARPSKYRSAHPLPQPTNPFGFPQRKKCLRPDATRKTIGIANVSIQDQGQQTAHLQRSERRGIWKKKGQSGTRNGLANAIGNLGTELGPGKCLLNPYHHHLPWEKPTHQDTSATAAMLRAAATFRSLRLDVGSTTSPRPSLTLCFFPPLSLPGCYNTLRPTPPHEHGNSELAQGLAPF